MNNQQPPKLAHRRENRRSTIKSGRTIPGRRERLEKSSERVIAHEKRRRKQTLRLVTTAIVFIVIFVVIISAILLFNKNEPNRTTESPAVNPSASVTYKPTVEIIDEDAISGGIITSRMKDYIGQFEFDLRALGIVPVRAVIPTGSIREIDFYLEEKAGFVKTIIDRGTAVSAEDTKRMLNYLESNGIIDFEYIDVRIDGRAYWK